MSKPRLFVFGDSWATNYFSPVNEHGQNNVVHLGHSDIKIYAEYYDYYGHWIDHMSNFYDVLSFGEGGCSNEQIVYQLSNLPDYQQGDRIIIILTTIERYTWVYNNITTSFVSTGDLQAKFYSNPHYLKLLNQQFVERDSMWNSDTKTNEKKYLASLHKLYKQWNPIVTTWVWYNLIENVDRIPTTAESYTNILQESKGNCKDLHLGVNGNYELFKYFASRLDIDISNYEYNPKPYRPKPYRPKLL